MAVKVTLLNHTPDPEQTVAMAAKLCYSPSGIEDIRDGLTEEKTAAFIDMLSDLGHASPTEHVSFTFGIEGISRACSHQLVRHRIASYSQQSQRYVDGTKFDFVTPPEIAKNEKALAAYNRVIEQQSEAYREQQSEAYREIRDALIAGYIREYLGEPSGLTDEELIDTFRDDNKKQFNIFVKKANEDARFILPNASTTKIVCTFNARSLHKLLCSPLLQPRAVGDPRGRRANAAQVFGGSAASVQKLRSVLPLRSLSGGRDVLRQDEGSP